MPTRTLQFAAFLLVIPAGALALMCSGDTPPPAQPAVVEQTSRQSESPPQTGAPGKQPAEKPPAGVTPLKELVAVETKLRPRHAEIIKKLQKRITREIKHVTLADFLAALSKAGRFELHIDNLALQDEGIRTDTEISVNLRNRTIEHALWRVLPAQALCWVIRNESVLVTTVTKAEELMVTRTYSIAGLLSPAGGNRHEFFFRQSQAAAARFETSDVLRAIIQNETSGPWTEIEGVGGSLSVVDDVLVVRSTHHVQREVAGLLYALKLARSGRLQGGAYFVERGHYPYDEDAEVRRALGKNVALDYAKKSLVEILRDLEKKTGMEFVIETQSLMDEGIELESRIPAVRITGVTLYSALDRLLEPLALTFIPTEGVIVVTTNTKAEELLVTAVYDVGDIYRHAVDEPMLRNLIINETSGPWFDVEGVGGGISSWENVLVIRQSRKVQREIANLLISFRRTMQAKRRTEKTKQAADKPETRFYTVDTADRAKQLADVIPQFVNAAAWKNETVHPLIRAVENTLVVRQSPAMHNKISRFLQHLDGTAEAGPSGNGTASGFGVRGFGINSGTPPF